MTLPALYPWQQDALSAWQRAGRVGVVEAVTGAGKTRLAIEAIREVIQSGGRTLVLVPSRPLLDQWKRNLDEALKPEFASMRIGRLAQNHNGSVGHCHVLVGVINSCCMAKNRAALVPPQDAPSLIVADEAHRYGATTFSKALLPEFTQRLGITATYERPDFGNDQYLNPYFNSVVFNLTYARARSEHVIAPLRLAYLGVRFTEDESAAYEDCSQRMSVFQPTLEDEVGVTFSDRPGEFLRRVKQLADEGSWDAQQWQKAWNGRRATLAGASGKFRLVGELAGLAREGHCLVFAQRKDTSRRCARVLYDLGVSAYPIDGDTPDSTRQRAFKAFEGGHLEALCAPLVLNEGIDLPESDLAIVVAASSQKREMIQRIGRVLRKKADGRAARVAIMFVAETAEDPGRGFRDEFIEFIKPAADEFATFSPDASPADIVSFLSQR